MIRELGSVNLDAIDKTEEENNITELLSLCRTTIKADLNQFDFKEAQMQVQKCKRMWNLKGDENTAFFPKICSARQRRNLVSSITSRPKNICTTNEKIEKAFIDHFEDIYTDKNTPLWFIENLHWSQLSCLNQENLCKSFK